MFGRDVTEEKVVPFISGFAPAVKLFSSDEICYVSLVAVCVQRKERKTFGKLKNISK